MKPTSSAERPVYAPSVSASPRSVVKGSRVPEATPASDAQLRDRDVSACVKASDDHEALIIVNRKKASSAISRSAGPGHLVISKVVGLIFTLGPIGADEVYFFPPVLVKESTDAGPVPPDLAFDAPKLVEGGFVLDLFKKVIDVL